MRINYDDKSNDPLNQFFGNNNGNARDNDKKDVSELNSSQIFLTR